MKHYAVFLEWSTEEDADSNILSVEYSLEEAKEIFKKAADQERKFAEESGWEIYEDTDIAFSAGEDWYYSRLYIQEVM